MRLTFRSDRRKCREPEGDHDDRDHERGAVVRDQEEQRVQRLMVGSNGPRMLGRTLPHVDAWNTWYENYGNSAERFAALDATITAAARDAGRDPAEIASSPGR
jgi:alkanesulfonate monooxygenase SsuD/methylene tetrahydromethanopterin reductase-like flavin-dependent oxidoreductase (luciferase family)